MTKPVQIGKYKFDFIIDDTVPKDSLIFISRKTGKEIGRIINIGEYINVSLKMTNRLYNKLTFKERTNGKEKSGKEKSGKEN